MIVVADTSPINYLILIERIYLLPALYDRICVPSAVIEELSASDAPHSVTSWVASRPDWVSVYDLASNEPGLAYLGRGERDGIALAEELHADILLIDEQTARREAEARQFHVTGVLGVLQSAARANLTDFRTAIEALRRTTFYVSSDLLTKLLQETT